jgi:hypothetical protein
MVSHEIDRRGRRGRHEARDRTHLAALKRGSLLVEGHDLLTNHETIHL